MPHPECGSAQSLSSPNATSIQGKRVKSPLGCTDTFVLKWVAANSRFECLAGGGAGSSPAAHKQIQYNNSGAFGASSGFTFTSGTRELSLGRRSESVLRLPSLDAPMVCPRDKRRILNGVRDNLLRLGWNLDQKDPPEPQFAIQMESKYFDSPSPASTMSEMHLGAFTPRTGSAGVPIQINVFRANNADNSHLANDVQLVFTGNFSVLSSDSTVNPFEVVDTGRS